MRIALEPLDVLFFRDARAFGAGADHRARSHLPPPPTTLHGALRTFLAWQRGWRPGSPLPPGLGSADDPGPLRVRGPFLGRWAGGRVITRHPFPADAVGVAHGGTLRIRPRELADAPWAWSDAGPELPWARLNGREERTEEPPAALEAPELIRYLLEGEVVLPASSVEGRAGFGFGLARPEERTGVALEPGRRTVREGHLYTAEFIRLMEGAVLAADVWLDDGPLPAGEGIIPLGGEARVAHFRAVPDDDWGLDEVQRALRGSRRFRLYLLTAAPFPAGSLPPGLERGDGLVAGRPVRLLAAYVGRPVRVGGFDLARGRPRPSRWAVPAGSVYLCELLEGEIDDPLVEALHGRSLFPAGSPEERVGWGHVLLGTGDRVPHDQGR